MKTLEKRLAVLALIMLVLTSCCYLLSFIDATLFFASMAAFFLILLFGYSIILYNAERKQFSKLKANERMP